MNLKNPHSILAALEGRPQDFVEIVLPARISSDPSDPWAKIARLARESGVQIGSPRRAAPAGKHAGGKPPRDEGGRTGVAEAVVHPRQSLPVEELFLGARERQNGRGLWLALDSLQDPHNVGAIFRTAAFFGVQGILLTEERSAPLTATVYDVAAGGVEHVPFTLQTNLQRGFEAAKEAGLWILGASEHAADTVQSIKRDRPWLLVIGNEESGMRRLTAEACDVLCRIPPLGGVTSLNASVAAGIFVSSLSLQSASDS